MKKRQRKKSSNKTVSFQLRDSNGEIIEDSTINLSNKDTLIMEFDSNIINLQEANEIFNHLHKSLAKGTKMIGYPKGITLNVLSVGN